jgi:pimeloyl-ACP methyl ester carboxylesterase
VPTLIFVHGACVRDASWWWNQMTEPLAGHGIASVAVALPSCGETGDGLGDLYADVEATRQAIAEAEAPVVLCGHSYGGMVITQAGADRRIAQLLYVTSMMPEAGQSLADLAGSQPTPLGRLARRSGGVAAGGLLCAQRLRGLAHATSSFRCV